MKIDPIHDKQLRSRVRLYGDLLGNVLRTQEDPKVLKTVQTLRKGYIKLQTQEDPALRRRLIRLICGLEPEVLNQVIRAFSVFFSLLNIAEESFQHRQRRKQVSSGKRLWHGSFDATFRELDEQGLSHEQLQTLLDSLSYRPVFTAHPTEAKRRTTSILLRHIFLTTEQLGSTRHSREQRQYLERKLQRQIQTLWKTDEVRNRKPSVEDEIRTGLYYFRESLFSAVPTIYRYIERATRHISGNGNTLKIPSFLKFGSWIGGDRDGNPFVLPETTEASVRIHANEILKEYIRQVKALDNILTFSSSICQPGDSLLQNLEADAELYEQLFTHQRGRFSNEPYRRKLASMAYRLEGTRNNINKALPLASADHAVCYTHQQNFLDDLYIIRDSLISHGDADIAAAELQDLIRLAETFGFNLVNLDIRQESSQHTQAVSEILQHYLGMDYLALSNEGRLQQLAELIETGGCTIVDKHELSPETQQTLDVLDVMYRMQTDVSPDAFGEYVISMTQNASHVMEVMFLAALNNLAGKRNNQWFCEIGISPLFETIDDLQHIESILEALLTNPVYRSLLEARGNTQEIMLGYSDSSKDGGIFASVWHLYDVQEKINTIGQRHHLHIRLFHGRGGTMARGGGPTHETLLSYPPGTVHGHTKFTEQGEVLFYKYNNPETAAYELSIGITGLIKASRGLVEQPMQVPNGNKQAIAKMARLGEDKYRQLIDHTEGLIDYFYEATPVTEIGLMNIGSRPSHRKKQDRSKQSLRAIPWVFGWAQSRHTLPAWYGVGSALQSWINGDHERLAQCREMYRSWPFFHSFLSNTQMALFKSKMSIARDYATLCADQDQAANIHATISEEYELTRELILQIAETDELMQETPETVLSLTRREPYLDPLNFIQITMLQRYRDESTDDAESERWLNPLLRTINAIAAGMRNTG